MMRNTHILHNQTDLTKKIDKWEQEIALYGVMEDESQLLSLLRDLDESLHPKEYSKILALFVASRRSSPKKVTPVLTNWVEKALTLDPENKMAKELLLYDQWIAYQTLFSELKFPVFRETDSPSAKKQVIDDYLLICQEFLASTDEQLDQLNKQIVEAPSMGTTWSKLNNIKELFQTMVMEVSALLKAAKDFAESFSGVFYASIHYENIQKHLIVIEKIKADWLSLFDTQENDVQSHQNALDQLHSMIGLPLVKERIEKFYRFLKYQKVRSSLGFQTKDELSLNMILTGNPGTGKTTLARLLAKIYHELGVLPRDEVIETNRSQLVGSFVGQTEENVLAFVKKAVGGVLFIDEAYSLKREGQSGNDYGQAAVDTLVSLMTSQEYGGKFAVILAGYPEEMRQFLEANTGLRSRFPNSNYFELADYTNEELIQIAQSIADDNDYILTSAAKVQLVKRIEQERVDFTFGNARTIKSLVLDAIFQKGSLQITKDNSLLDYVLLDREDFTIQTKDIDQNPKEQLLQLIGLDSVKAEMESLIAFIKIQNLRREKGLPVVPIQVHSIFTGNPGTGKTTVAKIYANLLKEYGILKRGHLLITSRADFVAGYVGQTAIKTRKKIREALGGVLFIDEAYSLLGQSSGDYGKEMIDTLVDEMTKHNENLVVVLAGYPNEMEGLLESNPGLRSRFKKLFHFPDYTNNELVQIMETYVESYQYHLNDEAINYLKSALENTEVKGNGRFATNLIDEAIQAQALRLVQDATLESKTPEINLTISDIKLALEKLNRGE
ncbi:AAA family ATPase [Pseudoneobacillus sp. C159]